jgi:hypothetical protein
MIQQGCDYRTIKKLGHRSGEVTTERRWIVVRLWPRNFSRNVKGLFGHSARKFHPKSLVNS